MGIIVAKTRSRWGKFRPWIFSGTILNAFVLYALFSASGFHGVGLNVFFAVIYILWGVTYTMMDIPFWSIIPAVTHEPKDRETMSVVGRTCAGFGNALITVFAMPLVQMFGGGNTATAEARGFSILALIVAVLFAVFETITVAALKERNGDSREVQEQENDAANMHVKDMFKALFRNDQALTVVLCIILINTALYITSNLLIYFFKYDVTSAVGGAGWAADQSLFNAVGGAGQILGMMAVYPLLRKALSNEKIFKLCLALEIIGYALILGACFTGLSTNMIVICVCGLFVFVSNGILTVLTTVYLSASVDYGEIKTGKREESVIFSMQTFVVKAASGFAVFLAGVGLDLIGFTGSSSTAADAEIVAQSAGTITGLRMLMTIIPIILLIIAMIVFKKRFRMTDERIEEMNEQLKLKHQEN
jgi:melibiose permease